MYLEFSIHVVPASILRKEEGELKKNIYIYIYFSIGRFNNDGFVSV